ncbi:GntR family transcriptional regulator [Pseudomonas kilonensis]|jgi:GntR family transcriptional regulator|uniref:GntR family transcriptional regulator n=1 Tax=Pseudomonas TaxID=286 RepID=UPI00209D89CA|nr:GntR family transcriptional regulator [Pseudomonas kilonensis]MCP1455421.1 GntR family transcriptional regulator [Pseudomonas kilonensis]
MSDNVLPLNSVPLHTQLRDVLRARILDGEYPQGGQMPSESELGALFRVSRITVRQALGDLQKEGLIFKIHGKGTFVAKPKTFQNVSTLQGLAESMTGRGFEVINRLLGFKFIAADRLVAERLKLTEGEMVAQIKRVRLINREPVSLEITYLPRALGERLEKADLVTRDIFLILENDCALTLGHADLAIDAVLADNDLTQALEVEPGSPIMRIERLTHDASGQPLDFEHLYYRGDAFQYRLRIDRQKGTQRHD